MYKITLENVQCLLNGKSTVRGDQRHGASKLQLHVILQESGGQIKIGFSCNKTWGFVLHSWVFNPARKPGFHRASAGLQLPDPSHRQCHFLFDEKSCLETVLPSQQGIQLQDSTFSSIAKAAGQQKYSALEKEFVNKYDRIFIKLVQSASPYSTQTMWEVYLYCVGNSLLSGRSLVSLLWLVLLLLLSLSPLFYYYYYY